VFLATEELSKFYVFTNKFSSDKLCSRQDKKLLHSLLIMMFYHSNLDLAFATHRNQVHGKSKNILTIPIIGGYKNESGAEINKATF
jgi:hypothetical protein